jgi:hypothetical protein
VSWIFGEPLAFLISAHHQPAQGPPIRQAQGPAPHPESKVKPNSRFSRFQFLLLAKCRGLLNGSKQ